MADPTPPNSGLDPGPAAPPAASLGQPADNLARYFETNRGRFTDEALIDAALAAGYERQAVDAALENVRAAAVSPAAGAIGTATRPKGPGTGSVVLAVLLTIGYVGAILLALLGSALASSTYLDETGRVTLILLIYAAAMLLGGLWSVRRLLRVSSLGQGATATFVALGVSVGLFVGLSGLCVASAGVR